MKWDVETYNRNAHFVSKYGQAVLDLLNPQPNETILDLGCGDGTLAAKISSRGGIVTAIDASQDMIKAARKRGINAHGVNAETMNYKNQFDAVFSNAALHWMQRADNVLCNVYRALKSGGRFCAEFGAQGNVKTIVTEIYAQLAKINLDGQVYNPWYFPSQQEYTIKLNQAGFRIETIKTIKRCTPLPTDITGWLNTFAHSFLQDVPHPAQKDFVQRVVTGLADKLSNEQGEWFADYVRLRFVAYKDKQ